mmetsp:Transcript_78118/g.242659  ORF Transcript_78118/g.242659 Transcript_78118/m.242659 type:complete len:217 (-) Transcript_78118:520-1170(-)
MPAGVLPQGGAGLRVRAAGRRGLLPPGQRLADGHGHPQGHQEPQAHAPGQRPRPLRRLRRGHGRAGDQQQHREQDGGLQRHEHHVDQGREDQGGRRLCRHAVPEADRQVVEPAGEAQPGHHHLQLRRLRGLPGRACWLREVQRDACAVLGVQLEHLGLHQVPQGRGRLARLGRARHAAAVRLGRPGRAGALPPLLQPVEQVAGRQGQPEAGLAGCL